MTSPASDLPPDSTTLDASPARPCASVLPCGAPCPRPALGPCDRCRECLSGEGGDVPRTVLVVVGGDGPVRVYEARDGKRRDSEVSG